MYREYVRDSTATLDGDEAVVVVFARLDRFCRGSQARAVRDRSRQTSGTLETWGPGRLLGPGTESQRGLFRCVFFGLFMWMCCLDGAL